MRQIRGPGVQGGAGQAVSKQVTGPALLPMSTLQAGMDLLDDHFQITKMTRKEINHFIRST